MLWGMTPEISAPMDVLGVPGAALHFNTALLLFSTFRVTTPIPPSIWLPLASEPAIEHGVPFAITAGSPAASAVVESGAMSATAVATVKAVAPSALPALPRILRSIAVRRTFAPIRCSRGSAERYLVKGDLISSA